MRPLHQWKQPLRNLHAVNGDIVFERYDPIKIDKYYSQRPLDVWDRLVEIGSPILGWWLCRKVDKFMAVFRSDSENEAQLTIRAADLKDSIVQGKSVTLIKSGQALALRPDLVKSQEYVNLKNYRDYISFVLSCVGIFLQIRATTPVIAR